MTSADGARAAWLALGLLVLMPLLSCAGRRPAGLGVTAAGLPACPASPNCVSSDASDAAHRVEPFVLAVPPPQAWRVLHEVVSALPRTTVVTRTDTYLHAECASALLGFVDDLELHLRPDHGRVAVRSASRLGHSDLGVNRRRVEHLRAALEARGVSR